MQKQLGIFLGIFLSVGMASAAVAEETKYLCISGVAGGLIYRSGSWQGTSYEAGTKYLMVMENDVLKSVKEFGGSDDFAMKYCYALEPTKSFTCVSNFDMFRYQPSTKRFVMAKTSGYTNEFEEGGINLPPTGFTPNISVGLCEAL